MSRVLGSATILLPIVEPTDKLRSRGNWPRFDRLIASLRRAGLIYQVEWHCDGDGPRRVTIQWGSNVQS